MDTPTLMKLLKEQTNDPLEQILLCMQLAEQTMGYVPREMRCFAALAAAGIGGKDAEGMQLLTAIVGLSVAKGVLTRGQVNDILDDPRKALREIAKEEDAEYAARKSAPALTPNSDPTQKVH